jgi:hypothetical protein
MFKFEHFYFVQTMRKASTRRRKSTTSVPVMPGR